MADSAGHTNTAQQLRARAEAILVQDSEEDLDITPAGIRTLVYELHTHQIELEMQNEDLQQAQEALLEAHDRISDLYEFSPVGYITVSKKGVIHDANLTLAEMLQLERSLFSKRLFSSFILPEDQDIFYEGRRKVIASGERGSCELRLQATGKAPVLWAALDIAPVNTGTDLPTEELRITVSDITARHKAQELAAAAATELREFEKRMEQTQRLESLGVMAGGIAHDFNNILQIIAGNADLAIDALPADAESLKFLQFISTATTRATDLTDQMLAYSGGGTLNVRPINLSTLTREMVELLAVSHKKTANLVFQLSESLPAVEGDPTQLRQVIMNLVTNASDATGDNGGTITVRTGISDIRTGTSAGPLNTLPPGQYVHLQVTDTGCGMTQNTLDHMFDPFFTTRFQGRGLGLAAVRGILLSHRGEIRIQSKLGHGTTATVLLPAQGKMHEQPVKPIVKRKSLQGSGTILVVDDEASIRSLLSMILKKCGYVVHTASNGEEALAAFQNQQQEFDCVLLDLTMPGMDGMETGAKLRAYKPGIKLILLSGYRDRDIREFEDNTNFDGFLKKPVGYERLVEMLSSVLAQK